MFLAASSTPLLVHASFTSFFGSLFDKAVSISKAASSNLNSQTMPLLEPAVNIDPNPAKGGGNISIVDGSALTSDAGPMAGSAQEKYSSSQISVYTVRNGDTLSTIADMFDVTVNTIIWANDIKGRVIHPGDMLIILPVTGVRYTVVKGDTVASIAKKYKSDAREIVGYNEVDETKGLTVGEVLIIPHGEIAAPAASSPKPKAGTTAKLHYADGPNYDSYYTWPLLGGIVTQGLHGYNGVDVGAPLGTPIFASAAGTVIIARNNGTWNGGYGNYVVIQHSNGTQTLYAHASNVLVSVGDSVAQGQTIALVGRTGQSTGYHLHFEIRGARNPFAN